MITLAEFTKMFDEMWDENHGPREYKYPPMSKAASELLNKAFEEVYLKETYGEKWNMTYEDLKSKVVSGYTYSTANNDFPRKKGERVVKLHTGSGGALLLIETFEKDGLPAILAAESILCHTDQGVYPLSRLTIKKIKANP